MTGESPAKHLARLKVTHPSWTIRHVSEGYGFTANRTGPVSSITRNGDRIWSQTLPGLEARLNEADAHEQGQRP